MTSIDRNCSLHGFGNRLILGRVSALRPEAKQNTDGQL